MTGEVLSQLGDARGDITFAIDDLYERAGYQAAATPARSPPSHPRLQITWIRRHPFTVMAANFRRLVAAARRSVTRNASNNTRPNHQFSPASSAETTVMKGGAR
jgi:hypothetical protein